jgi:hypothetical protein
MNYQAVELARVAQRAAVPGFRWGSIFAGTCVGIAVYVLLVLMGICAGIAQWGSDASLALLALNLGGAFVASVLGTFIAARSADLDRASQGAMHGLMVWSVVTMIAVAMTLCLVRDMAGNMAVLLAQSAERETALVQNDRQPGWSYPRETAGEAGTAHDRPRHALFVIDPPAAPVTPAPPQREFDLPAYAALMICSALAISLFGSIAGGLLGTRSPRRLDPIGRAGWSLEQVLKEG